LVGALGDEKEDFALPFLSSPERSIWCPAPELVHDERIPVGVTAFNAALVDRGKEHMLCPDLERRHGTGDKRAPWQP
jgi:hypothetical protein